MNSSSYRRLDYIVGWMLMVVSSLVYLLTMEPTASFWDCGEFIACADKLIVGHPPGAPFFMILMRMFTMFAPSPEKVGVFANTMSALASGATVMFLYWTIAYFARRLFVRGNDLPSEDAQGQIPFWNAMAVVGASAVGALAYTFTDTFWFSAVEGEVYALSSLFTAVVFWAILKWENAAREPQADRWIVLIAFLMGLSIGVHLLNLLAIPALGLVYYFRNYKYSFKGLILCLAISSAVLLLVLYGLIQGLVVVASWFELLFVNSFSLPFLSGAFFFFVALTGLVVWGIWYSHRKGKRILNLVLVCFAMLLLGYGSYATIVIRSLAHPTLDQNGVNNMFSLRSYLNREQYGDRPLVSGPYFSAPVKDYKESDPVYAPRGDRYEVVNRKSKVEYDPRFVTLFPRMWSSNRLHVQGYKQWVNIKGVELQTMDNQGNPQRVVKPTFGENLVFFFRYQLGFMYWRYFMWNFAGRQNDLQGYGGDLMRGNWICGIPLIDNVRLGPQDSLPAPYRENRAHNRYYMLPLLLGLVGMWCHWRKHPQDASVVLTLFILTGIAIVVYLNQKPYEPRERDYTFAASFYAFSIWIGLGVVGLVQSLQAKLKPAVVVPLCVAVSLLAVPVVLATENWDDHDRSHRYIARDFARNMLSTVDENGILFTYADNDTFPLWYVQEAEGFRRDVRVCNLTYLSGDWYVDVMNRKAYEGDALPFGIPREKYLEGVNDVVLVMKDRLDRALLLPAAMDFALRDDERTKLASPFVGAGASDKLAFFPTQRLLLPTPRAVKQSLARDQFQSLVLDTIELQLSSNYIYKNGFAVYGLLSNNQWNRSLYYSPLLPGDMYWGLDRYFVRSGITSRIMPVESDSVSESRGLPMVDTAKMAELLLEKYSFQGINDGRVLMDETCKRMIEYYVMAFVDAVDANLSYGAKGRAEQLLDRCFDQLPPSRVGWSYRWLSLIDAYYRVGATEKARAALRDYADECVEVIEYAAKARSSRAHKDQDVLIAGQVFQSLYSVAQKNADRQALDYLAQIGGLAN